MRRIGFIVFPGFQVVGLSASTVFEVANLHCEAPAYEVHVLSEQGGRVQGSAAIAVETDDRARAEHLDEALDVLRRLLGGERIVHRGAHVVVDDVTQGPNGFIYAATHGRGIWRIQF